MRFAIRLLLIEKLPGWCTSSSRSATFRVCPNFKSRISYKIKKMQEHEDISDDNFALVTKQRRGKKNQKKQFSKPRDYSRREVVQLLNCDVLAPNSMIPNFYKDTTAVDTTYTKVIDLKHPSSIQNHLLNEENFHHLKFIVAKTSALQGHYYIGDETGSMKWDATSSGSFFGYFPLGSIIETKKWKNGFIILQIKYKSLNEFGGLKFYHPICNLVINKEQFSNQFIQTPVLEPSAAVLHSCGVIAISRQTGKVLIGKKIHTNHYEECLNALEHHFSERKIHKYVPFRSSFLCNKRALTTWSTKELSKIAHYLPKYTKKGVKDEKWRKFWMFDEVLMNLSQLADEELQRRIEISDHRDGSCWAVPSTTSAYKIENKRYCLESHLETAARAFFYETGTHIHLTMDTKHIDIKSPALVEDNCCFDRYFLHFIHDDGLNLEGHKKRSFDSWQWVDIDDEEQNGMYGEYVSCILKSISAK